ncbi:hypothetical protein ACRYCC_08260 [Actinomadura scrupuli]|uniref:hypothetical protein n=1 Tax=Actinomadura scrupuli TaxID=559629 RepID=UPI003D96ECEF
MDAKQDLRQRAWAYAHVLSGVVFVVVAWVVARAFDAPHPLKQALFAASFWVAAAGVLSTWLRRRRSDPSAAEI